MRTRTLLLLTTMAMALTLALASLVAIPSVEAQNERPNLVFILTDDQTTDMLRFMAHTKKHLIGKGVRFTNTFATNPWCCPSRATIFRGQYSHNTGMWSVTPPEGGYPALVENGTQSSTAATWMRGAGYATAYVGTYFNHYNTTDIPPGYNYWFARLRGEPGPRNIVNENGVKRE